jgi:hypothetical protein
MVEIQEFECGCKKIHIGKKGKMEFCILHRWDNLPEGIDPKFRKN